jgi:hypothetical protein
MAIQIQLRRGVSTEWTSADPILAEGEVAVETDTLKFKVGNGVTNWNILPYATGATGSQGPTGPTGAAGKFGMNPIFSRQGTLGTQVGQQRFYIERAGTVKTIRASVGTSPAGSPVQVNVLVNGTTMLNTPILINPGEFTKTGSIAQVSVLPNDYLTVNIEGVGSVTAGANLTVTVTIE